MLADGPPEWMKYKHFVDGSVEYLTLTEADTLRVAGCDVVRAVVDWKSLAIMRREAQKSGDVVTRQFGEQVVTCTHVREGQWHKWYWTLNGVHVNEPALEAALNIAEVEHEK